MTLRIFFAAALAAFLTACSPGPDLVHDPAFGATRPRSLGSFDKPTWQVEFSPDSRLLAAANADGRVLLWNWPQATPARTLTHPMGATGIAFSPDGTRLASVGYDGTIKLWRVADGTLERTIPGHAGTIWSVAFSPDGRRVASGGEDKTVRIWNADDGKPLHVLAGHELIVWCVRFSPDGRTLASSSFDKTARLWNVETGALVRTLTGHTEAIVEIAFSPDGQWIATGSDDSSMRIWKATDGSLVRTLRGMEHVYAVAFSPDSRWVVSGSREKGALGTLLKNFVGRLGMGVAPTIRAWRLSDGAMVQSLDDPRDDVHSVTFSRDGRWLAASGEDHMLTVWRLQPPVPTGR